MTTPAQPLDRIQMLWVRGDLSRMELLSIRSFLAHGHPVDLYTYDCPGNVPPGVVVKDAAEIVARDLAPLQATPAFSGGSYGAFSDRFRYTLLETRGGWWSDVDVVCVKPWRSPTAALTAATFEHGYGFVANTCVMRFPAGHPVMAKCREVCSQFDPARADISQTGPSLLHRQMLALDALGLCVAPSVFCPVPWNASWQLMRPLWARFTWAEVRQRIRRPHLSTCFNRETVGVHLWHETWRAAGRDKTAAFSRTCLYERLQRRWNR